MANDVSTTTQLNDYKNAILAYLVTTPLATPAQLKTQLETQDATFKLARHTQIVDYVSKTPGLHGATGGVVSSTIVIATADTGYAVGDTFVITGGAGVGGGVKVTAVDGTGAITAVELTNAGIGYTSPVVDLSGSGDAGGVLTLTASAVTGKDQGTLLAEMLLETYP